MEVQGTAAVNLVQAIFNGVAETWHSITTGFPASVTGRVSYQMQATGKVMVDINLTVANGATLTKGATFATLASGYFSTTAGWQKAIQVAFDNNATWGTGDFVVTNTGAIIWESPTVTVAGASALLGQATFDPVLV